jgi:DNA-binding NarL/FixJ family response regulator
MSKHRYKIIGFFTLLGLASWILDALLESFENNVFYHHKYFTDLLLLNIPTEEIVTRSIMLLTLIIFGIYIDRYVAKVEKSEEQLQQSEQRLSRLAAQLLTIQESERSRISKELHDELGQDMMLLQFQLRSIYEQFNNKTLRHDLYPVLDNLEATIENLRRLTKDLSPVSLENLGLTAATEFLIEEFSKSSGIETTVMHKSLSCLKGALSLGVNGYLLKEDAFSNLISAIKAIREGKVYLSPHILGLMTESSLQQQPEETLSAQEIRILSLIAQFKSDDEIAESLHISILTLRGHIFRIKKKLRIKTRPHLIKCGREMGLVGLGGIEDPT